MFTNNKSFDSHAILPPKSNRPPQNHRQAVRQLITPHSQLGAKPPRCVNTKSILLQFSPVNTQKMNGITIRYAMDSRVENRKVLDENGFPGKESMLFRLLRITWFESVQPFSQVLRSVSILFRRCSPSLGTKTPARRAGL